MLWAKYSRRAPAPLRLATVVVALMLAFAGAAGAGPLTTNSTQPGQLIDKLEPPAACAGCHTEPVRDWGGSMMGNDFRDPSFLALLSISQQDAPGVGDYCLRCHGAGWFEGKSEPPGGDSWGRTFLPPPSIDRESIPLCDFCHRMERVGMRPSRYDGRPMAEGNGSVYIRLDDPWKGGKHPLTPLHKTGELCGACHDVSNPTIASRNDPSQSHPLERTYTEWKFSSFGANSLSCQGCHPPMRFPGAQTWLLDPGMVRLYKDVDAGWTQAGFPLAADRAYAWRYARSRNETFMRSAAAVEIVETPKVAPGERARIKVRVTNYTGHKLPTGFAEGRQLWIHLRVTDAQGRVIFEDGQLDNKGRLVRTAQTKVYEQRAGRGDEESFHFVTNDTILKDNRIPPRGFSNAAYKAEAAYIVGASYSDGRNWDDTGYEFLIPPDAAGPLSVRAVLRYETFSVEFVEWLRATDRTPGANHGGSAAATPDGSLTWGETTYKLWAAAAKGRPVTIVAAGASLPLPGALPGAGLPLGILVVLLAGLGLLIAVGLRLRQLQSEEES